MYEDNAFNKINLKVDKRGIASMLYDAVMLPYRYASKNPKLGLFFGTISMVTQFTFWTVAISAPFAPVLVPVLEPILVGQKLVTFMLVPFVDPPKVILYKQADIAHSNESIQPHIINHKAKEDINTIINKYSETYKQIFTDCNIGLDFQQKK
jgi:hypothetical protein